LRPPRRRARHAARRGRPRVEPHRRQGRARRDHAGLTMTDSFLLLGDDGSTSLAPVAEAPGFTKPSGGLRSRVAYAAAHVAPIAWADNTPGQPATIDWDATLAFRRSVYSW